jgi:hypothetical protein
VLSGRFPLRALDRKISGSAERAGIGMPDFRGIKKTSVGSIDPTDCFFVLISKSSQERQVRQLHATGQLVDAFLLEFLRFFDTLIDRRQHEVLKHFDVAGSTASFAIVIETSSWLPLTTTLTTPPPAWPSTVLPASSCFIVSMPDWRSLLIF